MQAIRHYLKYYSFETFSDRKAAPRSFRKNAVRFFAIALCSWLTITGSDAQAAPGDLDTTFGNGGVAVYPGMNLSYSAGIAVQPDGKVLVGGSGRNGIITSNQRLAVVRYLPNGVLDTGFGQNGVAFSSFTGYELFPSDMVLLPNGKIVMVGHNRTPFNQIPGISSVDMVIAVFSPQGVEETTYMAHPGTGLHSVANAAALLPGGKFLIVGWTGNGYKSQIPVKQVVMRMTEDGTPDSSFSPVLHEYGGYGEAVAVQPDGKIVVASGYGLTRYNSNGLLDTGFGARGRVVAPVAAEITIGGIIQLAAQPDGKIVGATTVNNGVNTDFAVFRLNYNGSRDIGFGTNGVVTTAVTAGEDRLTDVFLQPNGKILALGASILSNSQYRTALVRYLPNGAIDTSFGTNGIVSAPNEQLYPADGTVQPDGKILTNSSFRAVRYLGDAPLTAQRAANFDFDGDGTADFAVTRGIDVKLNWYAINNPAGTLVVEAEWGLAGDKIVPADYDGDRKTDLAVFRQSDGNWYILKSTNNSIATIRFGQSGDTPVPSDYDGDSKADAAVYRQGNWYILNSSNNSFRAEQFGISADKPVIGDFDGDGRTDLAVYREGTWYQMRSGQGFFAAGFGLADDIPVASDYDGDGKTDLAVYRRADGVWYLQNSAEGFKAFQFGVASDKPVPADYDGDRKTDVAVFRAGVWYIRRENGDLQTVHFGYPTDRPVQTAFQP
ncbi:MAG: hypothetical protein M3384_04230 [Acidobacteriota bacterium]|nr:hypothetical protein [Acidobacteriota bacterium]